MQELSELYLSWIDCKKCTLCSGKKQVFSDGDINSRIFVIGEGPARYETALGKPFVGPAGQLLEAEFLKNGIKRNDLFLTNCVRGWPIDSATGKTRQPSQQEMDTCRPLLLAELDIIKPRFILLAGGTAIKGVFNHKGSVSSIVGKWFKFRNIPTLATFHPAALLHSQTKAPDKYESLKASFERDIKDISNCFHQEIAVVSQTTQTKF